MNASKSHMTFIKKKNLDMDVYISSYTTQYDKDLLKVYDNVIGYDFYDKLIGQGTLIENALKKINKKYDYILVMRIDLFLKSKFKEIFNPSWDKIMWPSICFKPHHKCGIHPRVNDMMIYIPKKYFAYLPHLKHMGHDLWAYFIQYLNYDDLDTMIHTFHDSDSAKDYNPLYYIVNRKQSTIQHTKDIFNKYLFT